MFTKRVSLWAVSDRRIKISSPPYYERKENDSQRGDRGLLSHYLYFRRYIVPSVNACSRFWRLVFPPNIIHMTSDRLLASTLGCN
jgi:hypothetical protein